MRNQVNLTRKEPKMGPLIYDPGKEPVKTGYNYNPMKWNKTWYQNSKPERSSI